ncbi:MAG TPA: hypothetical protein VGN14_12155 [Candidatus Elarobacter sp.]
MLPIQRLAAAALGAAALALPVCSVAATTTNAPPQRFTLDTRMVPKFGAGEYDGTMRLTVYSNGIVSGTYLPSDGGVRQVNGGITGKDIWLEIGEMGRLRIVGTFRHGVIDGTVQKPGPDITEFVAAPAHQ